MRKFGLLLTTAMFLMATISLTSCDSNTCYECTGYDDGTVSLEDLGTICLEDYNDDEEALDDAVTVYEAFGGTCVEQ